MDVIKSLSKTFLQVAFLKGLIIFFGIFSLGCLLVFISVAILYFYNVALWIMVVVGWMVWLVYIAIFAILLYFKKDELKNKIEIVMSIFNKMSVLGAGMLTLKNSLIKARKKN